MTETTRARIKTLIQEVFEKGKEPNPVGLANELEALLQAYDEEAQVNKALRQQVKDLKEKLQAAEGPR